MKTTNKYFDRLTELKDTYPELIFDNIGYQYLSKEVRNNCKDQIEEIEYILRKTVEGFSEFNNFKPRKDGTTDIRLQYAWSSSFIGVGYFPLDKWKNYTLESDATRNGRKEVYYP